MKLPSTPGKSSVPLLISALISMPGLAKGQTVPAVHPEIVSAWKATAGDALLIFRYDGTYFQVEDSATEPGMERGTFTWDKTSSSFSVTTIVDTNGEAGLSHPAGATTVAISGNTMTYTVAGEGSFTFSRVVNTASAIVGSWFIPGDQSTVTFLADGTYYNTEEENDAPFGYDGMERGTYTWDPGTHILTATATTDTNGDVGLSSLPPGITATISGNSMTVSEDGETTTFRRITQIPTPLNVKSDFEVDKFINYVQTGAGTPALQPIIEYPFWGEAYIQTTVPGTGGTLTIASQAARPFLDDDEWQIEDEYPSLAALNATDAFPNGANYLFARTGGNATLSFPAGGTFPSAPEIAGDVEDGAWILGIWHPDLTSYVLGQNQVLTWAPHTAYDPATHLTVLSVEDYETDAYLLDEAVIQGDITSYDFGGKLVPGRTYGVKLEHVRIANTTTAGTGPFTGKLGYSLYNSSTRFIMTAPEAPASAPVINQQPVSQLPAQNSNVTLTVGTQDVDPTETFRWSQNNQEIPGQTGNSLSISNYSSAVDAGSYTVAITNAQGSVTSNPATLGPAAVKSITLSKDIEYIQTGASTVIVNPEGITPTHGGTYGFFTEVKGTNLALLAAPTVTPPAGTLLFDNNLHYNTSDLLWGYGSDGNEFNTDTQALIDNKFPNGTYTFMVNGVSVPLNLPGNSFYPNTPQFTLSGGTWVNGKYAMDAANPLTVTTNVFSQYGLNVDGHIDLSINLDLDTQSYASSSPASNFATLTAPAFTLPNDRITEIEADFEAIVSKSSALPGVIAAAYYTKYLGLKVYILPKITAQSSSQVLTPDTSANLQVSATGTPATANGDLNYQWNKDGINLPGLTSSNFEISTFTADDAATYTCTVSNDVGTVTSPPIYIEFADAFQSYAGSFGLNSVTTGAPDGDPDNDGINNLLEFILGGNPVVPNPNLRPGLTTTPVAGGQNLVFTYRRKLAAASISQTIEHAADLSSAWTPAIHGQNGVTIATTPVDAATEQVTVTIPSTGARRFVRLNASR